MSDRPNPDDLLQTLKRIEQKDQRGKLKVFLGMSPGVGKTYTMLQEAQEQKKSGVNVCIGIVETHGRAETAELVNGLKLIPRKQIHYKDTMVEELDIDAVLELRPEIILIDELAHTNLPGCRHLKRYQDVNEILDAGIDVFTTVNIQHIESRKDLVHQITGVQVRETVPDSFLENADQIELVDLSPRDLLKRLKEGKVYLGDRAERAANNFFKEEYITALRELALRFTAEKVDHDLSDQMQVKQIKGPWNTTERLLVALGHSPHSARLIRATRRMAFNLEAEWIALYVNDGRTLLPEDKDTLKKNLELARELGADVITVSGISLTDCIQRVANEKNVTQIVIGRPEKRFFYDLLNRGTILDELVRSASNVDVHVIRQNTNKSSNRIKLNWFKLETDLSSYWKTFWFMAAVTLLGAICVEYVGYKAIGYFYLVAVLAISFFAKFGPIVFSGIVSALAWNYFFIPPLYTLTIASLEDTMMCVMYLVVAIVLAFLSSKIKKQKTTLEQRERLSNNLYELIKAFSDAKDISEIVVKSIQKVEKLFLGEISILLPTESGALEISGSEKQKYIDPKDLAVASWSFENKQRAGWSTDTLSSAKCLCLPLIGKESTIGVLVFYPWEKTKFDLMSENLLITVVNQIAIAIEREIFKNKTETTKLLQESEKLHQTLLNSVSHELRTPLTSLIGNSTALLDDKIKNNQETRELIIKDIVESADRLNRVVENLLDMSRLQSGVLKLQQNWIELSDLISGSLHRIASHCKKHKIVFDEPKESILVFVDDKLFEHAIVNILMNAMTYSPEGSTISIHIRHWEHQIFIDFMDEGPGLNDEIADKVFDKFYRVPGSPTGGVGLGLSIVKGIVEAHGGNVHVKNREDHVGAVFTIELPKIDVDIQLEGINE